MPEVNPLDYEARTFRTERNTQALFNERVFQAGGVDNLLSAIDQPADEPLCSCDEVLNFCAGIWDSMPEKRPLLASAALKALAGALDGDVGLAQELREHVPDFESRADLKSAFQKIRAVSRARHRYYFQTRYQARNLDKLKAQLFPKQPQHISRNAHFTCIGSCFATNLGLALIRRGVENLGAIRYQDDTDPLSVLGGVMQDKLFKQQISGGGEQVVILTAGFAEEDGAFLSPEQVSDVIVGVRRTLLEWNPQARLIVTVSPVPLKGTATGFTPYEANAISKSIMRLGVAKAQDLGVEYFPSYELVTQHFPAMGICPIGTFNGSPSYVNEDAVLFITDLFIGQYLPWIDLSAKDLPAALIKIRHIGP